MRYDNGTITADIIDPKTKSSVTSGKFIGRTLLYVGIALAVTFGVLALVATPLYFVFAGNGLIGIDTLASAFKDQNFEALTEVQMRALIIYGVLLIVSVILMIAMQIWINISMIAKGKVRMVPFMIYAGTMGVLLASFSLILPFYEILMAIGVTTLIFAMMAGVAFLLGDKVKWFGVVGFGMLGGLFLIGLISIPLFFFLPIVYVVYYYIFSFVSFIAMLLITAFDFWRMKKIASKGSQSNDLALYCAFNLYVDFIYILIRILSLLARSKR